MPTLTFAFCGDIIWSAHVDGIARRHGIGYPFQKVAPLLRQADHVVANMEGCISTRGTRMDKEYTFRAPTGLASALKQAGIDMVTLGNNHAKDYGAIALLDTFEHLRRAGVRWAGAGASAEEASQPIWIEEKGLCVAVVCFTAIVPKGFLAGKGTPGVANLDYVIPSLPEIHRRADVVIAVPHWGTEGIHTPSPKQKRLARMLSEAGAHLIVGHHPHVVQGYERIGKTHVLYSVGNFVHTPRSAVAQRAAMLWAEVYPDGVRNLRVTPLWIQHGQPTLAPREHAQVIARLVSPLPCVGR